MSNLNKPRKTAFDRLSAEQQLNWQKISVACENDEGCTAPLARKSKKVVKVPRPKRRQAQRAAKRVERQNRLESTINNLSTTSEGPSALKALFEGLMVSVLVIGMVMGFFALTNDTNTQSIGFDNGGVYAVNSGSSVKNADITSRQGAVNAIDTIDLALDLAIKHAPSQSADLGALGLPPRRRNDFEGDAPLNPMKGDHLQKFWKNYLHERAIFESKQTYARRKRALIARLKRAQKQAAAAHAKKMNAHANILTGQLCYLSKRAQEHSDEDLLIQVNKAFELAQAAKSEEEIIDLVRALEREINGDLWRFDNTIYFQYECDARRSAGTSDQTGKKEKKTLRKAFVFAIKLIAAMIIFKLLQGFFPEDSFGLIFVAVVGGTDVPTDFVGDDLETVAEKLQPHSNLGQALASIERRMGHLPMSTMTLLPGGDGAPKVIFKTNGRDNIGLVPFAQAFGLEALGEDDVLLIEANGVQQDAINEACQAFVQKGYRPVGTRMLIKAFNDDGTRALGADYIEAIDVFLGKMVDVRSYFSLGSAPALKTFTLDDDIYTEREGEDEGRKVLWFTGKAKHIFADLDGVEGGLPISEKAMEAIFGSKNPGQPRLIVKLCDGVAAMVKGNFAPMAVRAFLQADGSWKFLTRAHFENTDEGKAEWRKGYDFVFIEDDTPKGRGKDQLKTEDIKLFDANGKISGWLIAQAKNEQGKSLVSYQVLALVAKSAGLDAIAAHMESLISNSVQKSVDQVERDLDKLDIPGATVSDLEKFKELLSAIAPGSARQTRKNHLGFGAEVFTGYIHMNVLIKKGTIVVGDGFGLNNRAMVKRRGKFGAEDACGGKNPILDHQQTWVGKLIRIGDVQKLRESLDNGKPLSDEEKAFAADLFGADKLDKVIWMTEQIKWVLSFAPALTRGSILMNAEDVADLAGDDDGDQLWFSFGDERILEVFRLIKDQAQGNTLYAIENNKGAQLPSETGARDFKDLLTAEGDELTALCRFIMAPNKGQGPVGYMANICTILMATFQKVDNGNGGMAYENDWVERLQATLNLMQQTSIDLQKRIYLTICLMRWTKGDLRKEKLDGRGLVPGYDFPGLAHDFNPNGFHPESFSSDEYKAALTQVEMPHVPSHWVSGESFPVCTDNDSQYAIRAIGSWLIWEVLSLIVTGKPADWGDVADDAKGGLDPWSVSSEFIGEDGPDFEAFAKKYALTDEQHAQVLNAWRKSPSELYSWKTQGKDEPFVQRAPAALELNHEIAMRLKESYKPSGEVKVHFREVEAEIKRLFSTDFAGQEWRARKFVDTLIDGFYLEAALANNNKATSERFQNSEERSGVEALGYILESLENSFTASTGATKADIKLARAFAAALNPRERRDNKAREIGVFVMLISWWTLEYANQEWIDLIQRNITPEEGDKTPKYKVAMAKYGVDEATAKKMVNAKHSKTIAPELLKFIKGLVNEHFSVNAEKMEAKATWLVDDALSAAVKAIENTEIVMAKRDVLKEVKEATIRWTDMRDSWDQRRVAVEILLAATGWFEASWFEAMKDELKMMASQTTKTVGQIRKELKNAAPDADVAALKTELKVASKASSAKKLLAMLADDSLGYVTILNALCNPKQNPLAREFVTTMLDNSGPIVNVERAWQRADDLGCDKSDVRDWTWELGDWVTHKGKGTDPNTGMPRQNKTVLYAHSRVEWSLTDTATARFTRILLEGGVSIYKLTKVPAQSFKTWRYFDAFVYEAERTPDYSLVHGVGHLVSLAIPTQKQADEERYRRMAHLGHLEWACQAWTDVDPTLSQADVRYHVEGLREEIDRVEALKDNALMVSWGHLLSPITWGMQIHSWAGKLTKKAINGRAWAALAQLGKRDPAYHDQPKVNNLGAEIVTTELKALNSNGNHMPFKRNFGPRNQSQALQRAKRMAGKNEGELDDTTDLVPFTFGDDENTQHTYAEWLDFIEGVAANGTGPASAMVLAGLWYGAHGGRIAALDPNGSIFSKEIAEKIQKRLLRCPAYEVRLHIEDLLKGEYVAPVSKPTDKESAEAFFAVLRRKAGLA